MEKINDSLDGVEAVFKIMFIGIFIVLGIYVFNIHNTTDKIITPCPVCHCAPMPNFTPIPQVSTPSTNVKQKQSKQPETNNNVGLASYYSRSGCLGCSKTLTMANGEPLDDDKLTVAYNRTKLNTMVKITNLKTNMEVIAKVTDRGGFERHGKIIDLSVATKNAIGCGDVCKVKVEVI